MRNNTLKLEFHPYQRRFRQPLKTSHGIWEVREGIILRLIDEVGNMGWGEIAPLPWFGSETLEQALEFCLQLWTKITEEEVKEIPARLPACQFGFESALESLALTQRRREEWGREEKEEENKLQLFITCGRGCFRGVEGNCQSRRYYSIFDGF